MTDPKLRVAKSGGWLWSAAFIGLLVAMAGLGWAMAAEGLPVERVAAPRGSWVMDVTGTLTAAQRAALDRIGAAVAQGGTGQLAVAVVGSTDGRASREYATDLFNRWGIGFPTDNRGVLVFAALADRKAEIVLGKGLANPSNVAASREIMAHEMVPRFRAGDAAGALLGGAAGCATRILSVEVPAGLAPRGLGSAAAVDVRQVARVVIAAGGLVAIGVMALLLAWSVRRSRCPRCRGRMSLLADSSAEAALSEQDRRYRAGGWRLMVRQCARCGETVRHRIPPRQAMTVGDVLDPNGNSYGSGDFGGGGSGGDSGGGSSGGDGASGSW